MISHVFTSNKLEGKLLWISSLISTSPAFPNSLSMDAVHLVTEESWLSNWSIEETLSLTTMIPPFGFSPSAQRCKNDTRSSGDGHQGIGEGGREEKREGRTRDSFPGLLLVFKEGIKLSSSFMQWKLLIHKLSSM